MKRRRSRTQQNAATRSTRAESRQRSVSDLRVNAHEALARQPPVHSWQPVDHCAAAAKVNEGQVQVDGFLVWARATT